MTGIGYAFISAYLKGEEAKMLSPEHLSNTLKAADFQEVIDSVRDTDIGGYLEGLDIGTFDELDEQLWKYFGECLSRIEWFKSVPGPARDILRVYTNRYDILNIKTSLQNILTGVIKKGIPAGSIYGKGLLEDLINSESLDEVISVLNTCNLGVYANVLENYRLDEVFRKEVLTDTGMEQIYFSELLNATGKMKDGAVLARVFRTILDLTNLQIVLRAVINNSDSNASVQTISGGYLLNDELIREILPLKLTDVPSRLDYPEYRSVVEEIIAGYEKDGDISVIDESIEKLKFRLVREILSPTIMSPAVVVWYLIMKETEVRNLRLILKAAMDNIQLEEIKDYMVFAQ